MRLAALTCLVLAACPPLEAGVLEVELTLPLPARLKLLDRSTVAVAPFLLVMDEGERPTDHRGIDVRREFDRYLRRLIRRHTKLKILESGPVDFPTFNLNELAQDSDFWRFLGERSQADLILAGSLDFDVQDRRGYLVQPVLVQGVTYYRQVLVERTGFDFDILILVCDGKTGELLYHDNFKDFREFDKARIDPLAGMFENLYALEGRIAGIFTQRWVRSKRAMFTD